MLVLRGHFLILLCVLSVYISSVYSIQFSYPLALVYQKVSDVSVYLNKKSLDYYRESVKTKINTSTNAAVKACTDISTTAHSANQALDTLDTYIPRMQGLLNFLNQSYREKLEEKINKLKVVAKRLKQDPSQYSPRDVADANRILEEVIEFVVNCQLDELQVSNMTWGDYLKYCAIRLFNLPFKFFRVCLRGIIDSGRALTIISVFIAMFSVHYAYKRALDAIKVIWFFIKVPFRIIRGIVVFIWRIIFGSGDQSNEIDFGISEEQLKKECVCTCTECKSPQGNTKTPKAPTNPIKKPRPKKALLSADDVQISLIESEEGYNQAPREPTAKTSLASSSVHISSSLTAVVLAAALLL